MAATKTSRIAWKFQTGEKVAFLTVLRLIPGPPRPLWECECVCGKIILARGHDLAHGRQKSCGCMQMPAFHESTVTHGMCRNRSRPRLYETWASMVQRCHNPSNPSFAFYGGRGITVCDEWRKAPLAFIDYVGPRPSPRHTLDRIDNQRGYEPGNVQWAEIDQQQLNRRSCGLFRDIDDNPIRIKDIAFHLAMSTDSFTKLIRASGARG